MFLSWASGLRAQSYLFDLQHIGIEDGLPARMTYHMVQDQQGFLWFSSQMGIHRFDGQEYKTFTNTELNLPERLPAKMAMDGKGRLWYGAPVGKAHPTSIGVIDLSQDLIQDGQVVLEQEWGIKSVRFLLPIKNSDQALFFMTEEKEVLRLGDGLQSYGHAHDSLDGIQSGFEQADGSLVGIYHYHLTNMAPGRKAEVFPFPKKRHFLFHQVFPYLDGYLFNGGTQRDVHTLAFRQGEFSTFTFPGTQTGILPEVLWTGPEFVLLSHGDSLLIKDYSGRTIGGFDRYHSGNLLGNQTHNAVLMDRQKNLWITTFEGLYKISIRKNPFTVFYAGDSRYGILKVGSQLWTGGGEDGLPDEMQVIQDQLPAAGGMALLLLPTSNGHILMAAHRRWLTDYDPVQKSARFIDIGAFAFAKSLYQEPSTGHIWIGTDRGLFRFLDEDSLEVKEKLSPIILPGENSKLMVRALLKDTAGVWVTTSAGLYLVDPSTETVKARWGLDNGLPWENFNHLYLDQAGIFWLACRGGGLVRWNRNTGEVDQYTMREGLSNDNLYAVYEDGRGSLWLPSDYGLMAFDKETQSLRTFHTHNGIAHEEFNTGSHFRDGDSLLYFGGLNGVTRFDPNDLYARGTSASIPLLISKIEYLDQEGESIRMQSDLPSEDIQLDWGPEVWTVRLKLAYLDFEQTEQNQFAYRIPGYQDKWEYLASNAISLIHMPVGSYDMEIKAKGASGEWKAHPLQVSLVVHPPFYQRLWFRLSVLVAIVLLILFLVRLRLRALVRSKKRLEVEVQRRTQKIEAQAEALKEMDRVKSRFFANVTHELRTPLTLMIGPASHMLEQDLDQTIAASFRRIKQNGENLLQLINQLLDLSKMESQQLKVKASRGDLVAYTRELTDRFLPLAREKQIDLSFHCATNSWEVLFDRDLWDKIVLNLLGNAMKFTPMEGKVSLILGQEIKEDAPWIFLEVKDNGIGISPLDQERIFERFYQADQPHAQVGGTGIGLSLVKELVELQQGVVSLVSEPGNGAAFSVRLPVLTEGGVESVDVPTAFPVQLPSVSEEPAVPVPSTALGAKPEDSLQVLIVEDHSDMRDFIQSCLLESGYSIHLAKDGNEGLKMAQELIPDLIISDVMMPGMDGFEFTRQVRQFLGTSHIPLILLTARASMESRLEGLRRGADAYLTKPFHPAELRLRVAKLIELRRFMQARYGQAPQPEGPVVDAPTLKEISLAREDSFMEELRDYIHQHLADPKLNVDQLAHHFGVSRSQLYRKLKSLTRSSAKELIREARLEKAKLLLLAQELSVAEVAYETGFSSPQYFAVAFKKYFGYAPTETVERAI